MYNNILVAYDGSETSKKALVQGIELAKANREAELKVITVWDFPVRVYEAYVYQEVAEKLKKHAEEDIEEVLELIKDLPNSKQGIVLQGHPATTIIDYAKENDVDVILIGSRGLGGVQRFFLGSVSFQVVQRAECAVLVTK